MLHCYNKGCLQKFDPDNNGDSACVFHPGAPVFHDASKKWSCCAKSSVDFTTFLQIPGCARGPHNPVKPPEQPKPERPAEIYDQPVLIRQPIQRETAPRPPEDEEKMPLNKQVDPRLLSELDKVCSPQPSDPAAPAAAPDGSVPAGTGCKNSGCRATYTGPQSDRQVCYHHPGGPVFHEGLKYWSCCQRKTTEFDSFMAQEGCEQGRHRWALPDAGAASTDGSPVETPCRCDHHQGKAGFVTMDVFAKLCVPEECRVTANRVACTVELVFAGGRSKFSRNFRLRDVIDPAQSCVNLRATKVEILLKKANAANWPSLELLAPVVSNADDRK